MAKKIKSLRDIINAGRNVPKGEEDFLAKHTVAVKEDPAGNKEDVFSATNVEAEQESQKADPGQRHGYRKGQDVVAYEEAIHEKGMDCNKSSAKIYCPVHGKEECPSGVEEELSPGQKKLDKNKNNKLDKEDFKLLRKEEKNNEKEEDDEDDDEEDEDEEDENENEKSSKNKKSKKDVDESVDQVDEVLTAKDPASKWIKDFVKSDNPKFAGKSKKERIQQALAAYYAKKRGE